LIFFDTSVLIEALRGRSAAARIRELTLRDVPAYVCAINIEELWRGARRSADEAQLVELLQGLLVVPLGEDEGTRAGKWRRDFAAKGITLGQADCLIAAAAVTIGATLATRNVADFPMTELRIEDWSD
jgi:predicted nucleic acid-binding protein